MNRPQILQRYPAPIRGINQALDSDRIDPLFCSDAQNMIRDGSKVVERKGSRKVNATAANSGAPILSQHDFQRSDGTRQHLVQAGDTIYKLENGALTTAIRNGVSDAYPMRYASGLDVTLMCNGVDFLAAWDGTVLKELTTAPVFREILYYNLHFFGGNVTSSATGRSQLRNSPPRDYQTWDATDVWNIETGDGDEITGLMTDTSGWLNAMKADTRTRIRGTTFDQDGDDHDAQQLPAVPGLGSRSPLAVLSKPVPTFIDEKGVMAMIGNELIDVTAPLLNFWRDEVNYNAFPNFISAFWQRKRQMWIAVATDGEFYPNTVIVWDIPMRGVWIYKYPWTIRSLKVVEDQNDIEQMYIGSDTGFLYEANFGTDDDGTAIDSYFETGDLDLGKPGVFKQIMRGIARLQNVGDWSVQIRMQGDSNRTNLKEITSQAMQRDLGLSLSDYIPISWRIGKKAQTIRLRFRNANLNQHWGIHEFELMGRILGTSK